ncbi:hypothetical protein LTR60_007147, partial [Cryomyces antarcticus]
LPQRVPAHRLPDPARRPEPDVGRLPGRNARRRRPRYRTPRRAAQEGPQDQPGRRRRPARSALPHLPLPGLSDVPGHAAAAARRRARRGARRRGRRVGGGRDGRRAEACGRHVRRVDPRRRQGGRRARRRRRQPPARHRQQPGHLLGLAARQAGSRGAHAHWDRQRWRRQGRGAVLCGRRGRQHGTLGDAVRRERRQGLAERGQDAGGAVVGGTEGSV